MNRPIANTLMMVANFQCFTLVFTPVRPHRLRMIRVHGFAAITSDETSVWGFLRRHLAAIHCS